MSAIQAIARHQLQARGRAMARAVATVAAHVVWPEGNENVVRLAMPPMGRGRSEMSLMVVDASAPRLTVATRPIAVRHLRDTNSRITSAAVMMDAPKELPATAST